MNVGHVSVNKANPSYGSRVFSLNLNPYFPHHSFGKGFDYEAILNHRPKLVFGVLFPQVDRIVACWELFCPLVICDFLDRIEPFRRAGLGLSLKYGF